MDDLVEITVEVIRETDRAYLVSDGEIEAWVPISQVYDETALSSGARLLEIPAWIAEQQGLI